MAARHFKPALVVGSVRFSIHLDLIPHAFSQAEKFKGKKKEKK